MRALLAAVRCEKGNVAANLASHLRLLDMAASAGCDIAVFPEMSLTGSVDPATHPQRLVGRDSRHNHGDPAMRLAGADCGAAT